MQLQLEKVEPARLDGLAGSAKHPAQQAGLGGVDRAGCCPEGVRGLTGQRLPGVHLDFKGGGRRALGAPWTPRQQGRCGRKGSS